MVPAGHCIIGTARHVLLGLVLIGELQEKLLHPALLVQEFSLYYQPRPRNRGSAADIEHMMHTIAYTWSRPDGL